MAEQQHCSCCNKAEPLFGKDITAHGHVVVLWIVMLKGKPNSLALHSAESLSVSAEQHQLHMHASSPRKKMTFTLKPRNSQLVL